MAGGARVYDAAAYQSGLSILILCGVIAVLAGMMLPETPRDD